MFILMMAVTLAANPSQAQKLIKKELQTENNEKDGFQYQWNRYTYLQGKDTLDAAFDLNNKRITPNGYRKYEKGKGIPGVRYVGGGRFQVYSKNTDAFGNKLISGYNVKGECVLPETVYTNMYYAGDGFFSLRTRNDLGKVVAGLYDYKGNCVIPETKGFNFFRIDDGFIICDNHDIYAAYDMQVNCIISEDLGYTWIAYYPEYEFFWCEKPDGRKHSISKDGQYYAEGYYDASERREFDREKRRVPNWSRNNNSKTTSSSSGSSYSSTSKATSNNNEPGLLYRGEYTISEDVGSTVEIISIYEDRIVVGGSFSFDYKSTNSKGNRVYSGNGPFGVYWRFYVSPNYNIRLTKDYPNPFGGTSTAVNCRVTKGQSSMPVQNGGEYYGGSEDYNGTSGGNKSGTSGNPVQPHQITESCPICHGSGKCNTCNGRGWIYAIGSSDHLDCPNCKPDGHCSHCGGSGKVTKTRYY